MAKVDSVESSQSGFKQFSPPSLLKNVWAFLPCGGSLPADVWESRHRFLLRLTWFHALLIALIGVILGYSWELSFDALFRDDTVLHTFAEGLIVAVFAGIAAWVTTRRLIRATAVGFGLMSASAILVHLSGGYIELHFHFFVMLVFLALYQDWVPYLLAIVYVAIHHGVVGVMWPEGVYNHAAALSAPWTWAGIHAFFVLCAAVGSVIAWRFNEKAFAQSKLILDCAGEGIYGLDRDGKVTFINPAAASLLKWQATEAIGKDMHQVLRHRRADGSDFADHASPIFASLKDGARRQATDELFCRQDGTSFPVDYVCTPIVEREELTGLVVAFRDISRRNQRELTLRESDARKRAILESALDAIISIDHEGKIIEFNPAAERTFGYSRSEAMGKAMADLIVPPSLRQAHNRGLAHFLATGQGPVLGKRIELTAMRAGGIEFPAELTITPIDTGRLPIFTGFIRDITERKQAEEDLQNRYKESAILHDVSQMLLSSTDLQSVLEKILDRTLSVVSLDLGNIRLFDSSGQMRMSVYQGYRDPENVREHHADVKGPSSGVLTSRVFASGKSLMVEDITTTEGLRTLKKEGACSAIIVPIMTQDEMLGAIEVGRRTPNKFRPDDVRLLEAIGNQVGMAVQKVRLTEETERRAHEQEALNIIAKSISQSLRRDELLNIALDKVLEVTGRERVSIRLKNPTTGQVTLAAHRGFSQEEIEDLLQRARHQATEQVMASGQPLVINNRQEVNDTQSLLPQSLAVAWIPMKAGARVVGILGISASSPVPFSEREVEFLQAIANMIGVALENARLFQETERQNRELSALYAALMPFASADADQVLQKVVERLKEATESDAALIRICDKETKSFLYPAHVGFPSAYLEATQDLEQDSAIGTAYMTGEPIIAANIAEDPRLKGKRQIEAGFRSCVFLPLRVSGELRGVVHLASRKLGHFGTEKTAHLTAIARQMAIAMENLELFQDVERRARE
ncbi:MAG TPA: GAF domain-containing protein, partial [Candidatus Udaeobacter sp.]|nr:GAF domain-containing protein [Candidatus Udaeobacter sp.]